MEIILDHFSPFFLLAGRGLCISITGQIDQIHGIIDIVKIDGLRLSRCADVLASDLRFNSALIMDDFPTFDFPANATSLNGLSGILLVIPQTVSKFTLLITIVFSSS